MGPCCLPIWVSREFLNVHAVILLGFRVDFSAIKMHQPLSLSTAKIRQGMWQMLRIMIYWSGYFNYNCSWKIIRVASPAEIYFSV